MTKKRRAIVLIAFNVVMAGVLWFVVYATSRPCRGLNCLEGPPPNPTPGRASSQENIPDWLKGTPPHRPRSVPDASYRSPP
jgi:hypothetical protein